MPEAWEKILKLWRHAVFSHCIAPQVESEDRITFSSKTERITFVPGRSISDNTLLAKEILHS